MSNTKMYKLPLIKISNKKIDKLKNLFTCNITNISDVSFMNCLRRIIESEIPWIAFDEIHIEENNTLLHNEFIQHRIELLPLYINYEKIYDHLEKNFKLTKFHDDKKKKEARITLYSNEFENINKIIPPYNNYHFPITKLCYGQKIALNAKLNIDIGKTHAKYSPTAVCLYEYEEFETNIKTKYNFKIESCGHVFGPIEPDKIFILGLVVMFYKLHILECDLLEKKCEAIKFNKKYLSDISDVIFKFLSKKNKDYKINSEVEKLIHIVKEGNTIKIKILNEWPSSIRN